MKNKLKEIRKSKGMTQEELAEKSGVSRGTIVALENNEGKVVTKTSTLLKLAAVLGCAVSDIFFG
ncbi:MAG: helix-turn-helix transcriptional regulator [Clostridia bacterium]|nr:helix-turn-helix transcriptional regulator [Clostridia bacterium]